MKIYDENGEERSVAWLNAKYGSVIVSGYGPYRVAELHEVVGPSALTVTVLDEHGSGVDQKNVVFWWPDAPLLVEGSGYSGHGVVGRTDLNGAVGFGMGKGAYYDPNPTDPNPQLGLTGPHAVWLYGEWESEFVTGLGMLAGTNHAHMNVVYQFGLEPEPPPEPEPEPEPEPPLDNWALLLHKLDRIIRLLEERL